MDVKIILKIRPQQKWLNIPSGFSMSKITPFKRIENDHDVYRDKDYMKSCM